MVLLANILDLSLPLKNPVLIFSLILFIILFAPIILNKLKIPHLIGLIIAGAVIGPNGLNLMLRDSSIILFGTVGLLYIMFLAGVELDLVEFRKNKWKSLLFGMFTFLIPMSLGTAAGIYLLKFPIPTSVLLASMFASHTLISYPIISRLGIVKNRAVNVTVGGTIITDTLALLVLAVIAGMSAGEVDQEFWIRIGISIVVFGALVLILFPLIGRWFFKKYDDSIGQYIFVLGMVFLGAFLAEAAGIEAIIGAFLAGLALNRLIPRTSPLMNRIEFVGNALFIPFFLIGVGMLIDFRAFFKDLDTIIVAATMTVTAIVAKFLAAWLTQQTFRFSRDERRVVFGLSTAQAAATLAAVLVGYNIILGQTADGDPIRLLNDSVLNGTILMILVTCTVSSFATQKGAQNIALQEAAGELEEEEESAEKILIPVNNPEYIEELVNLSVTIKSRGNTKGLYALHVIEDTKADETVIKSARKMLEKASVTAAATDNQLHELFRYDLNAVNGITSVIKENGITDLVLGLHRKKGISTSFFGNLTQGILMKSNTTTLIYNPVQPISTIKRHLVIIPENAEKEIGFAFWVYKIWNIGRNTGAKLSFYGADTTLAYLKEIHRKHPVNADFITFSDWNDFLIISRDIRPDDNMVIVMSRKNYPSFQPQMARIPTYLNRYFTDNNYLLVFPVQAGAELLGSGNLKNPSMIEPLEGSLQALDNFRETVARLFKRR